MRNYIVLYRDETLRIADPPLAFTCHADDTDHAEEQARDAYYGCDIVWVVEGTSVAKAMENYYGCTER